MKSVWRPVNIRSGDVDDVFKLDEDGIKEFLNVQKPRSIDDLMVAYSMCRPGLEDRVSKYSNLRMTQREFRLRRQSLSQYCLRHMTVWSIRNR